MALSPEYWTSVERMMDVTGKVQVGIIIIILAVTSLQLQTELVSEK